MQDGQQTLTHDLINDAERARAEHRSRAAIHRVVLVAQSASLGGMETLVADLARDYVSRGIAVRCVIPEGKKFDEFALRCTGAGGDTVRLDTDARAGRIAQAWRTPRFYRMLRSWRPDAVHLHTGGATGGLGVVATARAAGVPGVIVTEHDVPCRHPGIQQRLPHKWSDRLAHATVAVSRRNAALRVERLGLPAQFSVVLNGIPPSSDDDAARACNRSKCRTNSGIPQDAFVLGSVVRLAKGKGLEGLLRAFARAETGDAMLLLVGDGPRRGSLERLARSLKVRERVVFAGHQARPERFMDAMDAFVLPVPAGSMSIALLEAMERGLPPIITFGGPEEAVRPGETGLWAEPNSVDSLTSAITRLANEPGLRADLGRAARHHVHSHYTIERVASDYLAIYGLAKSKSIPPRLRADSPNDPRPGDRCRCGTIEAAL
jgi:glycosyltransferase involved in cell wall biosynthesis